MCSSGGGGPDYAAAAAASKAEAERIKAEQVAEERKAELATMQDKQNQAELEAKAKSERRMLLSKAAFGDDEEDDKDLFKPSTRKDPKATQSILKSV